jgi:hypothetical protein
MRKIALIVAVAVAATAPTAAFAAKKSAKPKVYDTTAANQNDSGYRLVRDGVWNLGLKGPAWSKANPK